MASVSYGYFGEVGEVGLKKEIRAVFRCLCPHERNGDNIDVRSSKVHFHHCIVPTLGQNEPLPAVASPVRLYPQRGLLLGQPAEHHGPDHSTAWGFL